ncbi:hypothetical protein EHYA_03227 [Embleya hyalina]|uniref:Uncharacterized protein n=1 Tax=Embleya hyalina TaxID=516124 RepID=A0A401YLT2_9ACTN|nr:hypothetical protein EHYA_03227 [Embleya hyalina]
MLDADPLRDIRNTTAIHAVVLDGRLIDGAEVAHAASTTPPPAPGAPPVAGCGRGTH